MAWVRGKWLGWKRGTLVLHMIPHRAGLNKDPLHTSFLCLVHMSISVYFLGGVDLLTLAPSVGNNKDKLVLTRIHVS